jgi:hypothetical protein
MVSAAERPAIKHPAATKTTKKNGLARLARQNLNAHIFIDDLVSINKTQAPSLVYKFTECFSSAVDGLLAQVNEDFQQLTKTCFPKKAQREGFGGLINPGRRNEHLENQFHGRQIAEILS